MRYGKHILVRVVITVLTGLVVVPAAYGAGGSPDDRAVYRGSTSDLAPASLSPDDRTYARGNLVTASTRIVSPDDRAFARELPVATSVPVSVVSAESSFDWRDAMIGGTFGLMVALVGLGGVTIALRHRRSALRAA
jgi:hypothetical protein